ncbi:MAG: Asp-tRNA(Asn)/Glu-tRNA(Gln) amidotransferase GatCAB subunit A [Desulfurococcales archaeon ex4484_42]|nr:MAG: Asp-tRNA(Asn)/Glu-tRNA(Gln) amidotransferase GatCAB subunit A [Desulfurococcales archaeon ex4484_42]
MRILTLLDVIESIRDKPKTLFDYIEHTYDIISKVEDKVRAYITLRDKEHVLKDAKRVYDRLIRGSAGKLAGTLIAIKDNISTKGLRTTCASKILEDYVPPYDATVVERLKMEDAIIIGKTNMDEFAMGSTTENSAFFPTKNPWDLSRVPGGSSGGSAVATAAFEATAALGSDTGGSIRAPASFTGCVGLKPTYGLVSRYGLIAYASSMDQIGPITRTVKDAALILDVIAGPDLRDSTSLDASFPKTFLEYAMEGSREGVKAKLVVIEEMVKEGVERSIYLSFVRTIRHLEANELEISWVSKPIIKYALPAYYIIAMAEASSNLARYDGLRYGLHLDVEGRSWYEVFAEVRSLGFGKEVKRRILLGTYVLSAGYYQAYYLRASKVRRLIRDALVNLLKTYDCIISPTMPVLSPRLGERIVDPLKLYAIDVNTVLANLAGIPAISIPSDLVDGLPVGLQLMSNELREDLLLKVSSYIESILKITPLIPPLVRSYVI